MNNYHEIKTELLQALCDDTYEKFREKYAAMRRDDIQLDKELALLELKYNLLEATKAPAVEEIEWNRRFDEILHSDKDTKIVPLKNKNSKTGIWAGAAVAAIAATIVLMLIPKTVITNKEIIIAERDISHKKLLYKPELYTWAEMQLDMDNTASNKVYFRYCRTEKDGLHISQANNRVEINVPEGDMLLFHHTDNSIADIIIITPHVKIMPVGTTFGVDVSEQSTMLYVHNGIVMCEYNGQRTTISPENKTVIFPFIKQTNNDKIYAEIINWLKDGSLPLTEAEIPHNNEVHNQFTPNCKLYLKDGSILTGRVIQFDGSIFVFQSQKFGRLHIPADTVIRQEKL